MLYLGNTLMPLYSYKCDAGHKFDQHTRLDGVDAPTRCPWLLDPQEVRSQCNANVQRTIAVPARAFPGADSWRK